MSTPQKRQIRKYAPIWTLLKQRFETAVACELADKTVAVVLTVHHNDVKRTIKAVQKEKWMDASWKFRPYTQLQSSITSDGRSGDRQLEITLAPYRLRFVAGMLLKERG